MQENAAESQCPKCGGYLPAGTKRCPVCGSAVRREASSWKIKLGWPPITDSASALQASRQGVWASGTFAGITLLVVVLNLFGLELFGVGLLSLFDVACFAAIAWGINRMSQMAAILGLVLYVVEQGYSMSAYGIKGIGMTIVLTLMFCNGIRGTFAYHRFKKAEAEPVPVQ